MDDVLVLAPPIAAYIEGLVGICPMLVGARRGELGAGIPAVVVFHLNPFEDIAGIDNEDNDASVCAESARLSLASNSVAPPLVAIMAAAAVADNFPVDADIRDVVGEDADARAKCCN